jgi:predicted  nucleic acid-binding Zn-ribbon protein
MLNPTIEKLLVLQEKDLILQKVLSEIERIPQERTLLENLIKKEEEAIELAKSDLNAKEVEKNDLDLQVKAKEADIERFKNQQLEVKKNEEYRALNLQIEQAESDISAFEEREIELMYAIDAAREAFNQSEETIQKRIEHQNQQILQLEQRLKQLKEKASIAQDNFDTCRLSTDTDSLESYQHARSQTKRPPYIVAIRQNTCEGCHLKVSNEVFSSAGSSDELVFCDQCARIVYRS